MDAPVIAAAAGYRKQIVHHLALGKTSLKLRPCHACGDYVCKELLHGPLPGEPGVVGVIEHPYEVYAGILVEARVITEEVLYALLRVVSADLNGYGIAEIIVCFLVDVQEEVCFGREIGIEGAYRYIRLGADVSHGDVLITVLLHQLKGDIKDMIPCLLCFFAQLRAVQRWSPSCLFASKV